MRSKPISMCIVVIISLALTLSYSSSIFAAPIKLIYGHTGTPAVTTYWAAEEFKARLEKYSKGEIIVDVHGASALGSDKKLLESVKLGTIDICCSSNANYSHVGRALQPFDLPYIVHGGYNFYRVLTNPEIRSIIEKRIMEEGFKFLMMFPIGLERNVQNSKREVRVPEDAKGIKIRVTASPVNQELLRTWGFSPVPIAWSETYTAVKQGIVNGTYIPDMWAYLSKVYEVCPYQTDTGGIGTWHIIVMNLNKWNKLSPPHKKLVDQAATEADLAAYTYDNYLNDYTRRKMIEHGNKLYTPTTDEMKLWMEAGKKIWEEQIKKLNLDRDLIKKIQDAQLPLDKY